MWYSNCILEALLESKIKMMKATDPCVCGSGKGWKSCCGVYLAKSETVIGRIDITGKTPVRFFLADVATQQAHGDEAGNVLVFTNRAQALGLNERLKNAFQIVGMGQDKWELFQRDIPNHVVVTDAVA